jgi:O-antigen ligase
LRRLVLVHTLLFAIALSWGFGGNALWLRTPLLLWGSLALPLPLLLLLRPFRATPSAHRALLLLLPLLGLNLLVGASLLNPTFHPVTAWGSTFLVRGGGIDGLPSCAQPLQTARALWLTDCLYLSGFAVFIFLRQRRTLRLLLWALVLNTAVLAVFGTLQKLSGADGLYFGLVPSTNPTFFASFIYHNHWGPFALLGLCAALGLMWRIARRNDPRYRDFWHSPAPILLLAILVISVTPPLSSSRSCTLLLIAILLGTTVHAVRHLLRQFSNSPHTSLRGFAAPRILLITLPAMATLLALTAIFWLAAPVVRTRLDATRVQISEMQEQGSIGSRVTLYRDTLNLALDRPLFGWGKGSYGTAFYNYNTQVPKGDRLPVVYADAHSDWLQCFAEIGLVGSLLTALMALLPLRACATGLLDSQLPRYLLVGCALVLLYAWVEFPFGNPALTHAWWLCFFVGLRYPQAD